MVLATILVAPKAVVVRVVVPARSLLAASSSILMLVVVPIVAGATGCPSTRTTPSIALVVRSPALATLATGSLVRVGVVRVDVGAGAGALSMFDELVPPPLPLPWR